jgi:hypothetical protein
MTALLDITNTYTRRARLTPALIVVLPLGLAVLSWSPDGLKSWTVLWSLFVWAGGTALMAQVARDRGREKEKELFHSWGGKPTTRLLRYAGCENPVLVTRRHAALQKVLANIHLPTELEESAAPQDADHVYDTCVRWLLEQTRDQKKFHLLFEENCNYGFRRNLWGMKPIGIFLCALGFLLGLSAVVIHIEAHVAVSAISYGGVACTVALLTFWVFWCNPTWVKLPAEAYAERLLAASDTFDSAGAAPKKAVRKVKSSDKTQG